MGRKKKEVKEIITIDEAKDLQKSYEGELETNPKYSLEVDPENKYGMSDEQKEFIRQYVQFKSIATAAELTGIEPEIAKQYFIAWNSQQEIRRINLALYHRQFATKLLDLDEIGGYLTSLLTDENVPIGDRLRTNDKLKVVDLLIKLNEMKINGLQNPNKLMNVDIAMQIKNLSIQTIQQLLLQSDKNEAKTKTVDDENLTFEEKAYLSTLSGDQILKLLDSVNKKN